MLPPRSHEHFIERTIRNEWGRILASLNAGLGDLELAEDCLQDAVEAAMHHWQENLPKSPAAWLIATARRKAIDRIRRDQNFATKTKDIADVWSLRPTDDDIDLDAIPDSRLELIFTCCHPSLTEKTQIALTLRTIAGLTVDEIARAFLDEPRAMAQRLTRAKKKTRLSVIPFKIPDKSDLPERLKTVLGVIYLIYNEGYAASSGARLTRVDLIQEAIRLGRIVVELLPEHAEVEGLLALMLLNDARRFARLDETGDMVSLEHQNRKRWDRPRIQEGKQLIETALKRKQIGPYQLQAAISALHCEAKNWHDTDWQQIFALYNLLYQMQPSLVIGINRAMAASFAVSAQVASDALNALEAEFDTAKNISFLLARSDIALRTGNQKQAQKLLEQAIQLSPNEIERRFLEKKRRALFSTPNPQKCDPQIQKN